MQMNTMIYVKIKCLKTNDIFETYLSIHFSLSENLNALNTLLEREIFSNKNIYVDASSGGILNPYSSLKKQNLYQGMIIHVY